MKSKKLHFKGDTQKVTKKKRIIEKKVEAKETWIGIENVDQLKGPILIRKGDQLLNYNPVAEKAMFKTRDPPPEDHISGYPWVATQVWVCQRIENKTTIRSAFDKFLSSSKEGIISCDRDAAGISETWRIEPIKNGYVLKNYWGQYLCFEDELRAVPELVDDCIVSIMTQNVKVVVQGPKQSAVDIELEKLAQYHTKGAKDVLLVGDAEGLAEAKRTGKLHEFLLERRAAVKKDKVIDDNVVFKVIEKFQSVNESVNIRV
jgi:protein FRG1